MRALLLVLLLGLAVPAFGDDPITVKGRIAPLGKVVEIEGEIVDGSSTRLREHEGLWLLRIDKVGGKKLPAPQQLRYHWQTAAPQVDLKGRVRVIGYESGEFRGIPEKAFEHIPRVATGGFRFETHFVVLKSLGE